MRGKHQAKPNADKLILYDGEVDAGLFLLFEATKPGQTRTLEEIAEACGCSHQNIRNIEQRALKKMHREFVRRGIDIKIFSRLLKRS